MTALIGVSLNIGSHAWYVRQVLAERETAARLGHRIEVRDAEDDPGRQVEQLSELIDAGASAIIVSATRADAIGEALDRCASRNIAVVGESIALHHPAVVAEVRVDDVAAGIPLGKAAAERMRIPEGEVARLVSVGFISLAEAHDRERGFLAGLRSVHPHVEVAYIDGRAQVELARAATRKQLDRLGPAWKRAPHALFGVDDESVIGTRAAFADAGVDLSTTVAATYGISPPTGPQLLDDGTITVGAAMFPEWHGRILVELAAAHLRGDAHPVLVNPPSAVVTAAGRPDGWDRYYRRSAAGYELDADAVAALGADR